MRDKKRIMAAVAVMILTVIAATACGEQKTKESEMTPTVEATPTGIPATPTAETTLTEAPATSTAEPTEVPVTPTVEPTEMPATPTPTPAEIGKAEYEAIYLGVKDYGEPETKKENIEQFLYRFSVGGSEKTFSVDNSAKDANGNPLYPIQNKLKEGYNYRITVKDDVVIDAT